MTETNTVKPLEYTYKQLNRMNRAELNHYAVEGFNIEAHRFPNKTQLITAILEMQETAIEGKLTEKQEMFCQLYAQERDTFGNGTQAYIEAYDIDASTPGAYSAAQASASRLLMDVMVLSRIQELLQTMVVNDAVVDTQIAFWIMQKANPMASIAAIRIYNDVTKRVGDKLLAATTNIQNNTYNLTIRDEAGRNVSQQFTDYMMEKTKAPQKAVEGEVVNAT